MRIAIIGSTQYLEKMQDHKRYEENLGYMVRLPCLDNKPELNEFGTCEENFRNILWADEVHIIWDNRSVGTVFDMGMTFALMMLGFKKTVRVVYLESKTFGNLALQMEQMEGEVEKGSREGAE